MMKKLLEDSDLGLNLDNKSDQVILRSIKHLAAIDELNEFYASIQGVGVDFARGCLSKLLIELNCSDTSIENIPSSGAFVLVCNFPHGLLDGLLLIDTVVRKRPDAKIVGNFPLTQVEKIADLIIDVDPFTAKHNVNISGIKAAKMHLANGCPLIVFPSSKIGTRKLSFFKSTLNEWSAANLKFIMTAGVPIIPAHISGSNSFVFELLGLTGSAMQMLRLGRELLNKEGYSYTVEVGQPIGCELRDKLTAEGWLYDFLRINIELLRLRNSFVDGGLRVIQESVGDLDGLGQVVLSSGCKKEFLLEADSLIFYLVGGVDVEKWSRSVLVNETPSAEQFIVGVDRDTSTAVCVAEVRYGDKVLETSGVEGLYTHQYFEYSHKYYDVIRRSIELGQRYVAPLPVHSLKFRQDRMLSTLIWQSAVAMLEKSTVYLHLIGTTSIREHYSSLAKSIISNYIDSIPRDKRLVRMAIARHGVAKSRRTIFNKKTMGYLRDVELTNKLIADTDHTERAIPSTLRYLTSKPIHILALSSNHKKKNRINALILLEK